MGNEQPTLKLTVPSETTIHQHKKEEFTVAQRDWDRIRNSIKQLEGKASPFASAGWAFAGIAAAGALQLFALGASATTAQSAWVSSATWAVTAGGSVAALVCLLAHFAIKKQHGKAADQIIRDMDSLVPDSLTHEE